MGNKEKKAVALQIIQILADANVNIPDAHSILKMVEEAIQIGIRNTRITYSDFATPFQQEE